MTEYALLKDGVFVKFMWREEQPDVATHKGYAIHPVVRTTVNNAAQPYVDQVVTEGVVGTDYVITTTITDKPQAEIDAIREARKQAAVDAMEEDLELWEIKLFGEK